MKKAVLSIILFIPIILFSQKNNSAKKILMVVSSYGKDLGESRPGYEFDEFTQAYLIFKSNNLLIDIASPKGGKVTPDKFNEDKAYNKAIVEDIEVMQLLEQTIATSDVKSSDYDAIYIVGGKGAMFDLPYDPSLQDIILNLYKRQETIISSVCHGPASLVNVKNGDEYIVKDVELTSFCNIEEDLFGKKWVQEFPFKLEDKLKSRGATFTQTDFMLSNVSVSGKFVTGQNPFSTTRSAEEVVKALGITPAKRTYYTDESSVYLIQDLLDGKKDFDWAKTELATNLSNYDIQIMAVYGYYKILATPDDRAGLEKGIALIELTTPHFFNENLQFLLAKTYISLDNNGKAKEVLNELVAKDLLKENAEELLATLK
jgi:putative intracellular protease/amidase